MAVNYLIFGDADSRDFDIEVFYNDIDRTPKRVYERVEVPNRNGAILIDAKRYEDVPVSYDCIALDDEDRKEFLNALASQIGYKRMEDSFNSDEYYSAVFEGDVEPNMTVERDKSTFTIYFTRKPQRWLKSGETAVSVESSDEITNPTLFASSPMLEVEGYGEIEFNGSKVTIENALIGETLVRNGMSTGTMWTGNIILDTSLLNQGDKIYIKSPSTWGSYYDHFSAHYKVIAKSEYQMQQLDFSQFVNATASMYRADSVTTYLDQSCDVVPDLYYGTASQFSSTAAYQWGWGSGIYYTVTLKLTQTFIYDGDNKISVQYSWEITPTQQEGDTEGINRPYWQGFLFPNIYGDSSKSALGTPTYIDCDLGEAYMLESGQVVSLNSKIDLGSDLPTLAPGANTVTFDNTITDLQIIPRWWKI